MNDHKFCFIICSNDDLLLEECIHYINHLHIPSGYEIELLTISDAASITQGYNEGMEASDARYKIYMHQDVFLLNRNILPDLLAIFQSDPGIGLVGMIGYDSISPNGIMWHWRQSGNLYPRQAPSSLPPLADYRYQLSTDGVAYAAVIDGFFMATCYDLPWDTTHLKGWDFYDAFQSISFLEHGYKIAVPIQRYPWCMHDDNKFPNMSNYNQYRQIFMKVYQKYLGRHYSQILQSK